MNSIELMEQCLIMLERHGYRPTAISAIAGELKVDGLELLMPTAAEAEEMSEAVESKVNAERRAEDKRILGVR